MSRVRKYIESHAIGVKLLLLAATILIVVVLLGGAFRIGIAWLFKIVVGSVLLLWLPGFFTTLFFFPHHDRITDNKERHGGRSLDVVERTTMAVLLSIVISSALVYALHSITIFFPQAQVSKLTPRNLSIAMVGFTILSGVAALWRQKILPPVYAIPIGVFPFIPYGLNYLADVAFTMRNLIVEGLGLVVVLILMRKLRLYGTSNSYSRPASG